MIKRTCDACGKVICKAPFGEIAKAIKEEVSGRNTMKVVIRSKDGIITNYDDLCGECTDGILGYIASRKMIGK